ncbi:MAG: hypothetical protein A4E53_02144 [Pelotomaculum sp. PtaB.Bin104]|nr:MAG: hypothetical protein A4E53_02144 [Pelotomaculum sp. PtaB.Bin104]
MSNNLLTNPSAETGDLSGWTASGVTVGDGGTSGTKCFVFQANASMSQNLGPQNPLAIFEVSADFAPAIPWGNDDPHVGAYVYFELSYGDGTTDIHMMPLRTEEIVSSGYFRAKAQIAVRENSSPTQSRIIAATRGCAGSFDNLSVTIVGEAALQEGVSYYGVKITRADGITVERSDGASKVIFNSDELKFQAKDELGALVDRIYFDSLTGKYIFDGVLTAETIEASNIEVDVNVTNILYAQKGNISELTVDQLDTSTMVAKYLANDTSDMGYIKIFGEHIQFIEASTDGSQTAQVLDRNSQPMYWTDDTHTTPTLDVTDYPVLVYVYTEQVKMELYHELDSATGFYVPKMIWGVGTGTYDYGKGFITKDDDGLILKYITTTGKVQTIKLSETGIELLPSITQIDCYTDGMIIAYNDGTTQNWRKSFSYRFGYR